MFSNSVALGRGNNLVQQKNKRTDLTPTGLLMEGVCAQNPVVSAIAILRYPFRYTPPIMPNIEERYGQVGYRIDAYAKECRDWWRYNSRWNNGFFTANILCSVGELSQASQSNLSWLASWEYS
jgi:hypothetical protein